jgi:dTDP-4-amino-4,6-dideoxygalactose transaminase
MRVAYENLSAANQAFFPELKSVFSEVLESGWYILGDQGKKFEKEFAEFHDSPFCLGVATGLDALTLSLVACDFPKGSEVIVPSNTYIATVLAVLNAGLKPVLVEPDIETYNIDPVLIEKKITKKTVAIMAVHLYGKVCEMDALLGICKNHQLKLLEDCAQAHNATFRGKKAGTFGDFGCFSFYPTKNLGALGDAGAILCKNKQDTEKLSALRNYGSFEKYYNEYIGTNSRLDEIQAAILQVKLRKLEELTAYKRSLADIYFKNLDPAKFILPKRQTDFGDVFHIFNIRHKDRDQLRLHLREKGVGTEVHYPVPPHQQKAMNGFFEGAFPISEEIHRTTLSLPISYGHNKEDISYVVDCLNSF